MNDKIMKILFLSKNEFWPQKSYKVTKVYFMFKKIKIFPENKVFP